MYNAGRVSVIVGPFKALANALASDKANSL
jgi:hypothetical protein